jgi:phosphatidylinositol-3,4,5-trisphosphate 3-phosphatase/dual-specificity protein phosphatase PTEN
MDLLRQIVASPRARHPEAGLDLCYVTENIIATSGPSGTYPQVAYRNPLKDLVKFLDSKHKDNWAIWEFRAEGTGYPDSEVYNRIWHYPWPDHHPPPFALVPLIMGSMRKWLKEENAEGRVAVVHCKAGKGRSGTISCSYLISEEGWSPEDAMKRFTERRMRPGFGNGISIPSQRRWITYVNRWAQSGKKPYVDRPVEIVEVHIWGLRGGVKIAVEGYVDEGKVIKAFHTFKKEERKVIRGDIRKDNLFTDVAFELMRKKKAEEVADASSPVKRAEQAEAEISDDESGGGDVLFVPSERIVLPSSDVNMDFERRNKSKYGGFTMVTSVAHVWFNTYFEGNGPEQDGVPDESGVFTIDFDALDGIRGSSKKGTKCFDKMQVVWKAAKMEAKPEVKITEPTQSTDDIPQARPADWRGMDAQSDDFEKKLGLRTADANSADISRASSLRTDGNSDSDTAKDELETVQATGPDGTVLSNTTKSLPSSTSHSKKSELGQTVVASDGRSDGDNGRQPHLADSALEDALRREDGRDSAPVRLPTADLPGDKGELGNHEHALGSMKLSKNTTPSS